MQLNAITGPGAVVNSDGGESNLATGRQNDLIASELHGKLYTQNYRGNTFIGGMSALTSISNATFTIADLSTTGTPIIGLYNPAGSGVNAAILYAGLSIILTALTATGHGGLIWCTSLGNSAVSTGAVPLNCSTLVRGGSKCKDLSGVAMTGLTNTTVVQFGSTLGGGSTYDVSEVGTAAGFHTQNAPTVENFDGGLFVPPGGVLALLASVTPVAHSAVSKFTWEEVPI